MVLPALKANDYLGKLNECLVTGEPLGDLDRYAIKLSIHNTMDTHPEVALTLRGMLAHFDGRPENAKLDMEAAAARAPHSLTIRGNLALVLAEAGYNEQAIAELQQLLHLCAEQGDWEHLEMLAALAISLGDTKSIEKIVHVANGLKKCSRILTECATILQIEELNDESASSTLDIELTDDTLRLHSTRISDERWAELEKLADELESLVN